MSPLGGCFRRVSPLGGAPLGGACAVWRKPVSIPISSSSTVCRGERVRRSLSQYLPRRGDHGESLALTVSETAALIPYREVSLSSYVNRPNGTIGTIASPGRVWRA